MLCATSALVSAHMPHQQIETPVHGQEPIRAKYPL